MTTAQPATVRIAALHGLENLLPEGMTTVQSILLSCGVPPDWWHDLDQRIATVALTQVMDKAAAISGDACIGLHLGSLQSIHVAGLLGYALKTAPTVRNQISLAMRYLALHQQGAEFTLDITQQIATLRYTVYDSFLSQHRHDAETTMGLCVSQWRILVGQANWSPLSVHFEHAAPTNECIQELRQFFACPVLFSEPFNGVRFPEAFLQTRTQTADSGLHELLTRYAQEQHSQFATSTSLDGRVRRLIVAGLSNGSASIESVAEQLNMTERTLQRHLTQAGVQFSDLLERTRKELAMQYLREPHISLTDVAFLVGYSELSAFHRAFKRWFGQTPLEYKQEQRMA